MIIGLDPSTNTGFVEILSDGTFVHGGELQLKNGMYSTPAELQGYAHDIVSRIKKDALVAIEGFSFGSKGKGVSTQYGVGFAIRFALVNAGIEYIEVTPSQVKKFSTGKGNTSKDNMTVPIFKRWGFEHKSDNVRDAYVLAQIARAYQNDINLTQYQQDIINDLRKANSW